MTVSADFKIVIFFNVTYNTATWTTDISLMIEGQDYSSITLTTKLPLT